MCLSNTTVWTHARITIEKKYYISVESITRQPTDWIIIICVSLLWGLSDSAAAIFRVNEKRIYTEVLVEVYTQYNWPMKPSSSERETKNINQII